MKFPQCFDCSDSISSASFPLTVLIEAVASDLFGGIAVLPVFNAAPVTQGAGSNSQHQPL